MGLASSQARLLSLTVRQHTIENRAQYLQAQKLRLANDSDTAYEKYMNALDATSLQTKTYDSEGKVHWIDGSFNNLTKYTSDNKANGNVYFVQDVNDGLLYQPKKICDAYNNAGGDMFKFFDNVGVYYIQDVHTEGYTNALNQVEQDKANGWNVIPYSQHFIDEYIKLKSEVEYPADTENYTTASLIKTIANGCKNSNTTGMYVATSNIQLTELKNCLNSLKTTSYYSGNMKGIIDYCLSFNISSIFDNPNNVETLTAVNNKGNTVYLNYNKINEEAKDENEKQVVDDQFKLSMLLNGGSYKVNNGTLTSIYDEATKTMVNEFTNSEYGTIGDALLELASQIMDSETQISKTAAQNNLIALLNANNLDCTTVDDALEKYQKYKEHVATFNAQDPATHTEYVNKEEGMYYEQIYNAIKSAGGCKEISDENAKSATWVNNMIKNAQVVLGVYDSDTQELDTTTASSNTGLREISNDHDIEVADSEYETTLEAITSKENKFQTELNQLEEERNAIQTEIESLKQIAKDNIASTFKTFT